MLVARGSGDPGDGEMRHLDRPRRSPQPAPGEPGSWFGGLAGGLVLSQNQIDEAIQPTLRGPAKMASLTRELTSIHRRSVAVWGVIDAQVDAAEALGRCRCRSGATPCRVSLLARHGVAWSPW